MNTVNHPSTPSVAEQVRLLLRRPLRVLPSWLCISVSSVLLSTPPVGAVELPIACVSGGCGVNTKTNTPITWVTSGVASANVSGNTLTVNQSTENVTLNWASFNISADGKVIFTQPSTNSIALNRIFQASPSQILGSIKTQLNSDASKTGGQVYLINPNGFIFGQNASVNAAGILVSTLGMSENTFSKGLLSAITNAKPALGEDAATAASFIQGTHPYVQDAMGNDLWFDVNGAIVPVGTDNAIRHDVKIIVQSGATISTTQANGRIMLASQSVDNSGKLTADDGQLVLAAGDKVYISVTNAVSEPLHGLFVEVGGEGQAINQLTGSLNARRGDVSIVGMAINQQGRISASTSVSANGSIHLLARSMDPSSPTKGDNKGVPYWQPATAGAVTLGSGSSIEVNPEVDDVATAVDAQTQALSAIQIFGKQIIMQGGSNITAHGGNLTMHASNQPTDELTGIDRIDSDVRLRIDAGAVIDLSGSSATRSVADNIVSVELRGNELADSPDQRNGALRGQSVTVDARVGTAIANVSGAVDSIAKNVAQRTSAGGTAVFVSTGDIVAADDAHIDVSGGQTTFTGATVNTSQLITADGKVVDIANAKEDVTYVGVISPTTKLKHDRWGVIENISQRVSSHYEAGYVQGSSAGVVQFDAPTMIVNATMAGHAVNGAYQRDPAASSYANGGQLLIGENNTVGNGNYRAPSIALTLNSPNINVADDTNVSGIPLTISTDYLHIGGFTRTTLYSNDAVTIADDATLNLAAGSSITVRAAQVNINSSITAPAGVVDIAAVRTANHDRGGGISVANSLAFNVNGQWVNDTEVANDTRPTATLFQNAGKISLTSSNIGSALNIGNDVEFIADGGAWLKASNSIVGGKGGSIALQSNGKDSSFTLGDATGLSAYGVNGANGGSFTLAAGRIKITDRNTWADAQTYDPASPDSLWYFTVTPKLFRNYGFSNVNLIASGGTLAAQGDAFQVAANTQISAVTDTLLLSPLATSRRSGDDVHSFSSVTTLLPYQRNTPATISLSVTPNADFTGVSTVGAFDIQQGAVISGDPGTKVNLSSSNGSINIEGSLIANAGSINAHISIPGNFQGTPYDPGLGIVVGGNAVLDTSGIFVGIPNDSGLLLGTLKDGGSISLNADRGSVLLEKNSIINVGGTEAALDIATPLSSTPYQHQLIAGNAGSISLLAAESIVIDGHLQAKSGKGDSGLASGGSLSIALTRNKAQRDSATITDSFPGADRIVQLTNNVSVAATPDVVNGLATISVSQLQQAGIDNLSLMADNKIKIDGDVNLSLQRRLQLDAPTLEVGNGTANLRAGYLSLGNSQASTTTVSASSGNGSLNIHAGNIDVMGSSALLNVGMASWISDGDIRFVGELVQGKLVGSLAAASDLKLQASRVYATTATQFTINNTDHDIVIEQGTVLSATPLSAASSLTITARNINQNGTVLAPFGRIELDATDSLSLGANSITSVSAIDALIPYGTTDSNGKVWLYNSSTVTALPTRTITLNGTNSVTVTKGATIDLSGGGDLYASEWVKGTGGSNDAFGFKLNSDGNATTALTNPGLFAIMPSLGMQLAPNDVENAAVLAASGLQAGDSIYLSGSAQLAAGYYTLLPARYALLPGTYLVSAVPGFTSIQPGMPTALPDGTPVVAGYRSFGNTGLGGASYNGFAIYPGSWGRSLAEYRDSYASNYFVDNTHKTVDAGQLSIVTGNALSANGNVNSKAAKGGQAATIDVSARDLQIVGNVGSGTNGVVQLQDSVLNGWQAGRLLLGGTHTNDGSVINVAASSVTVAGDAHLIADEVVLVARDQVAVNTGGSVQTTAAVNNKAVTLPVTSVVTIRGDGADKAAVIAVSDIDNIKLMHDNSILSDAQGVINLAAGSMLASRGALNIDASGGAALDGTLDGRDAQWTLSSGHIVFGDADTVGQLTVNADVLNSLQVSNTVNLFSTGAIDFTHYSTSSSNVTSIGSSSTPLSELTMRAATVNHLSNDAVQLHANSVNLSGVMGALSVSANVGQSVLTVDAQNISITNNAMTINGFAQTNLQAQQIKVIDNGTLSIGGDLDLIAARMTAGVASNGMLMATGDVKLSSVNSTATLSPLELGGSLTIQGTNITDDARIIAPSAIVSLNASDQLSLGSNASIDASGVPVYAAGIRADSSGGVIKLNAGNKMTAAVGSALSVAGSANSNAGTIDIHTGGGLDLQSTLNAQVISGATGGSITISAKQINGFAVLNDKLQSAGFTQQQSIYVQQGDLQLANNKQVSAHDVQWVTEAGSIHIDGVISAPSTTDRSTIRLYGADGVSVAGQLHADGDATSGRGGIIELGVSTDAVNHASAAIDITKGAITADGSERGRLRIRAPVINGDVDVSGVPTDTSKLSQITMEAVLPSYTTATFSSAQSDATNFINAGAFGTHLQSLLSNNKVSLSPGIELVSDGDINLGTLDLYTWNINSHTTPVALTVRTVGNINVTGTISDGFTSSGTGTRKYLSAANAPSGTIRLVAGSDINSVDPLTLSNIQSSDIVLANNAIVRSGTGDISLVATHDVTFGSGSTVYTGGNNSADQAQIVTASTGASSSFLINGGQVLIDANHDINGNAVTESVTAWQPRTLCTPTCSDQTQVYWGVDLRQFKWNVGTLGGGDVVVNAVHDVSTLSVAAADTGIVNAARDSVAHYGGGAIDLYAGNNINSGLLYAGRQSANVVADGAITSSIWNGSNLPVGLFVAMGDSQVSIAARTGITLASVVNPTILDLPAAPGKKSFFFTYGDEGSLKTVASSGDLSITQGDDVQIQPFFGTNSNADNVRKRVMPASVYAYALSGNINANNDQEIMYPSDTGNLSIFAANDINDLNIVMSDASDSSIPVAVNPSFSATAGGIDTSFGTVGRVLSARHVGDAVPISITAGGDINKTLFDLSKFTVINAGRDIVDMQLHTQNIATTDVSEIIAGRDVVDTDTTGVISIGGPGRLDIVAGRNIDLGTSFGIESTGRLSNANITDINGADITLMAGMAQGWGVAGFVDNVVAKSNEASNALLVYMKSVTGDDSIQLTDAIKGFKLLSSQQQRPFVLQTFFAELVASGSAYAVDHRTAYKQGYAAIDALFPNSRSDHNPYIGDISMLFSRVYTESGGNINMVVPGGSLNVGVAARPLSTTLNKQPGELGIVAEQAGAVDIFANDDVSVNSSRVFTLGGGDISIWSTLGNIDAGKGAKTSLSIPPPATNIDKFGNVTVVLTGAVAGSGIRTIQTNPDAKPGDVNLIAPAGIVDAGDAGIGSAGNINIAAREVVGAENINFAGNANGVPAATSGLGASLSGAAAAGGSNEKSAAQSADDSNRNAQQQKAPIAQAALSWLEVFVVGLGEENCKQDDMECLKRQKQ